MDIVTGADFRVVVSLVGGRKYTLAAPSFGEAGRLSEAGAQMFRPPAPVILEEVREALRRLDKADLVTVVDEFEAAEVNFETTFLGSSLETQEGRERVAEARQRLMLAKIAQARVEWLVRGDAVLVALRAEDGRLGRLEHLALLEVCLKDWEGPELPEKPDGPPSRDFIGENFPAGDIATLGARAMGLMQPTKEAVGN